MTTASRPGERAEAAASEVRTVRIVGVAEPIRCRVDEPILDAALAQGLALPHNCRGGACGTCRGRLLSGETTEGWIQSFALTDEERAAGAVLPCVARPVTDCEIALDTPLPTAAAAIVPSQPVVPRKCSRRDVGLRCSER